MQDDKVKMQAYWKENLTYITVLLSIWFAVSYLCGILIADPLDSMSIGGFKLGFWFANQGSQVIFVALICVLCLADEQSRHAVRHP